MTEASAFPLSGKKWSSAKKSVPLEKRSMHRVFLTPSEKTGLQTWVQTHHPKAAFSITKDETPVSNVSLTMFVRCPAVFKWPLRKDEEAFPINFGSVVKKWLLEQWAGHIEESKIQKFLKSNGKPAAVKLWVLRKDKKVLESLKKDFMALLPNMPSVEGNLKLRETFETFLTFVPKPQSAHLQKLETLLKSPKEYRVFFRRNQNNGVHDMVLMRTDLDVDIYEYTLGQVLAELEKKRSHKTPVDDKEFGNILLRVNSEDLYEFSKTLRDIPTNLKTSTMRIRCSFKKPEGLSKFIEFLKKKEAQLKKKTAQDLSQRKSSTKATREIVDDKESPPGEAYTTLDWNIDVLRKVFCEEQGVSAESLEQDIIDDLNARKDAVPKAAKGGKKTYMISKDVTKEKMGSKITSLILKGMTKEKKGSKGDIKAAMKDTARNVGNSSGFSLQSFGDKEETEPQKIAVDSPPPSLREICRDEDALRKHVQEIFQILRDDDGNADLNPPGEDSLQEQKARSLREEFKLRSRGDVKHIVDEYDLFHVLHTSELKNLHLNTKQNLDTDLGLLDSTQLYNMLVKMNEDEDDYWERWVFDVLAKAAGGHMIMENLTRFLTAMSKEGERKNVKEYEERLLNDDELRQFLEARYLDVLVLTPGHLMLYLKDMQNDPTDLRAFALALARALGVDENEIPGEVTEEAMQRQTSPSFPVGVPFQTPLPEPNESPTPPAGFLGVGPASSGGGSPNPSESSESPPWDAAFRSPPPPPPKKSPPPRSPASLPDISTSSHPGNPPPEDEVEDLDALVLLMHPEFGVPEQARSPR